MMCNACSVSPHLARLERDSEAFKAEGDALYSKAKEREAAGAHPGEVRGLRARANEWFRPAREMRMEAHNIRQSITKEDVVNERARE